tara:strand:- start:533 stop:1411 length:879 start_codon:yes stop_codon:yes gene_type:complete
MNSIFIGIGIILILFVLYLFSKNNNNIVGDKFAIHTVFILKENILFLEDWLKYHIHIGFDKFYLYDNTGSKYQDIGNGDNIVENKKNKYGIQYDKYINDEQTQIKFEEIFNKYKDNIVYIKWQPKNDKGQIIYGQTESINDYINKYADENDWTAFIDMDEFIYMKNYDSIQKFINDNKNYNKIKMHMKNFDDRFVDVNNSIFDINNSIKHDDIFIGWGSKNICKNIDLMNTKIIHDIQVNNEKLYDCKDINEIRFNHYNLNKQKLEWMKDFFNKKEFEFEIDNSMNKYYSLK